MFEFIFVSVILFVVAVQFVLFDFVLQSIVMMSTVENVIDVLCFFVIDNYRFRRFLFLIR